MAAVVISLSVVGIDPNRLGEIGDRLGLAYSIASDFDTGFDGSLFTISITTTPKNAEQAVAKTIELLQQVKEKGVTETEVALAKHLLASSYQLSLSDPDVLASRIIDNQVYGLTTAQLRQFPQQIEAVTWQQVQQVSEQWLYPERLVVVIVRGSN